MNEEVEMIHNNCTIMYKLLVYSYNILLMNAVKKLKYKTWLN